MIRKPLIGRAPLQIRLSRRTSSGLCQTFTSLLLASLPVQMLLPSSSCRSCVRKFPIRYGSGMYLPPHRRRSGDAQAAAPQGLLGLCRLTQSLSDGHCHLCRAVVSRRRGRGRAAGGGGGAACCGAEKTPWKKKEPLSSGSSQQPTAPSAYQSSGPLALIVARGHRRWGYPILHKVRQDTLAVRGPLLSPGCQHRYARLHDTRFNGAFLGRLAALVFLTIAFGLTLHLFESCFSFDVLSSDGRRNISLPLQARSAGEDGHKSPTCIKIPIHEGPL